MVEILGDRAHMKTERGSRVGEKGENCLQTRQRERGVYISWEQQADEKTQKKNQGYILSRKKQFGRGSRKNGLGAGGRKLETRLPGRAGSRTYE